MSRLYILFRTPLSLYFLLYYCAVAGVDIALGEHTVKYNFKRIVRPFELGGETKGALDSL